MQLNLTDQFGVVDLTPVHEDVRIRVRCDAQLPLTNEAPDLGPRFPWRCNSEIRRCLRPCGEKTGTPLALHALAIGAVLAPCA
jgi:hypothetical protein